jgi:hypothetical protein
VLDLRECFATMMDRGKVKLEMPVRES